MSSSSSNKLISGKRGPKVININYLVSRLPLTRRSVPTDPCLYPDDAFDEFPIIEKLTETEDCISIINKKYAVANQNNQLLNFPQFIVDYFECFDGTSSDSSGSTSFSSDNSYSSSLTSISE